MDSWSEGPIRKAPSASYARQVTEAKSPQEALLVVAQGIDAILGRLDEQTATTSTWGDWDVMPNPNPEPLMGRNAPLTTEVDEHGDVEVNIKPVTDPGRLAERRALAHAMELDVNLEGVEDAIDVYVKGGPLWLYTGNRDFVMSLPMAMRQQMVLDVEQDDHATAHEMGRDLLKDPSPGDLPSLGGGD